DSGEQDRAEHRGARDDVKDEADRLHRADFEATGELQRIAEPQHVVAYDLYLDQLDADIEEHEQVHDGGDDAAGPEHDAGRRRTFSDSLHVSSPNDSALRQLLAGSGCAKLQAWPNGSRIWA